MSCGRDNEVTLWNADGKAKGFDFFGEMPLRAALAHDGARVIAIDFNGRAAAWTSADGKRWPNSTPIPGRSRSKSPRSRRSSTS